MGPLGKIQLDVMQLLIRTFPQFKYIKTHEVSSGMTGVVFMLHLCDSISLYEMVPSRKAAGMPWHYWEAGGSVTQNSWHNSLPYEYALWKLLGAVRDETSGVVKLDGLRTSQTRCNKGNQRD